MRTWVIKPEFRNGKYPDDMMCIEIPGEYPEDSLLVWIQHDGKWQVEGSWTGCPTAHMFDVFEAEG